MTINDDRVNQFFEYCESKIKNVHGRITKATSKGTNQTSKANSIFVKSEEFNEESINSKDVEITYRLLMSDMPVGSILTAGAYDEGFDSSSYYQLDTTDGDIELNLKEGSFLSSEAGFIVYQDVKNNFHNNPLIVVLGNKNITELGPAGDEYLKGTEDSVITITKQGAMGAFISVPNETGNSWLHLVDIAPPRHRLGYPRHVENAYGSAWINSDGSIEMYGNVSRSAVKRPWPLSLAGTGYKLRSFICSGISKPMEIGRVVPAILDENYSDLVESVEAKTAPATPWPYMATTYSSSGKRFGDKILILGYPSSGANGYFFITDLDLNLVAYATTSFYGDVYTTPHSRQIIDVVESSPGVYKIAMLFGISNVHKVGFITLTGNVADTPALVSLPYSGTVPCRLDGAHFLNYSNQVGSLVGGLFRADAETATLIQIPNADFETFKETHTSIYSYGLSFDGRIFRRSAYGLPNDIWYIVDGVPVSAASEYPLYSAMGHYTDRFVVNYASNYTFKVGDTVVVAGYTPDSSSVMNPATIDTADGGVMLFEPYYALTSFSTVEYKVTKYLPDGHSEVIKFFTVNNGLLFNIEGMDGLFGIKSIGSDYTTTKVIPNLSTSDEMKISWKSFWTKDYT